MILWLAACQAPTPGPPTPTPVLLEGPALTVQVDVEPVETGALVEVTAEATDPDGVDALELYARTEGAIAYTRVEFALEGDVWTGAVPADVVRAPAVELYARAYDASEWRVPSTWPEDGARLPVRVPVRPEAAALPVSEDFENTTSTAAGLYETGWNDAALAFRGQRWQVREEDGRDAAVHTEGYGGSDPVDDWLVSPTISLEDTPSAEVRWLERGESVDQAEHSFWISTGSPDPDDGEFVQVRELEPPTEGRWAPAPVVDLRPWLGERVTLAWRYEGGHADRWAIDDVQVKAIGPDVRITDVVQPFLEPGIADTLQVTITNGGSPTPGPIALRGQALDGLAGFNTPVDLGVLGDGEQVVVELPVAIARQQPDNTTIATDLLLDDGTTLTRWPSGLLVGHPTTGILRVHTDLPTTLDLRIGTGDPRIPHVEEPVFQGFVPAGLHVFEVDLGEHVQYLPSEAGRFRWWSRLVASEPAQLFGFGLDFDGSLSWSTSVGAFESERIVYLPARPELVVTDLEVVDPPLVPGEPGIVRVGLRNQGGDSGPLAIWPRGGSPDLTVGTTTLDPGSLASRRSTTITLPITIAADHVDSTPVPLILDVLEGPELHALTVDVPVPWPAVATGSVLVVDDGVLDPDETSDVLLTLRNDGALATGPLTCVLEPVGGPTTTVTTGAAVVDDLEPGAVVLVTATLDVDGGQVGDTVQLELGCTSALGSWASPVTIVLGGAPWAVLPLDPSGDALAGASMDFREARWRMASGILELEFTGSGPISDPPVFELWMDNPGSSWHNHVLTLSNGTAQVYGVRQQGWTPLTVPTVTLQGNRLHLQMQESELDLSDTVLSIAAGTGFCGAAGFHCDQWPDAWGNPYVPPLDTSTWPILDW